VRRTCNSIIQAIRDTCGGNPAQSWPSSRSSPRKAAGYSLAMRAASANCSPSSETGIAHGGGHVESGAGRVPFSSRGIAVDHVDRASLQHEARGGGSHGGHGVRHQHESNRVACSAMPVSTWTGSTWCPSTMMTHQVLGSNSAAPTMPGSRGDQRCHGIEQVRESPHAVRDGRCRLCVAEHRCDPPRSRCRLRPVERSYRVVGHFRREGQNGAAAAQDACTAKK